VSTTLTHTRLPGIVSDYLGAMRDADVLQRNDPMRARRCRRRAAALLDLMTPEAARIARSIRPS
jgi:hypothetical protein